MSTLKIGILSTFALDFFTTLSIAIVAVFLGLRLINEHILLFPALTVLILSPEYFLPVREFSSDYHATLDGKNALQAIQKILTRTVISEDKKTIATWSKESQIVFDDVAMAYKDKTLLEHTHFSVKGFKKLELLV